MIRGETLADGVQATKALTLRFLDGFEESQRTTQREGLPNHVAWNLGHLALTMHRASAHLDGADVPERDFLVGGSLEGGGDAERFATESVAFRSRPVDEPTRYPSLARAKRIFENAVDRLASALRAASDATLEREIAWGANRMRLDQLAYRMIFHNGMHAGQIADLRRAMGMKGVIG